MSAGDARNGRPWHRAGRLVAGGNRFGAGRGHWLVGRPPALVALAPTAGACHRCGLPGGIDPPAGHRRDRCDRRVRACPGPGECVEFYLSLIHI